MMGEPDSFCYQQHEVLEYCFKGCSNAYIIRFRGKCLIIKKHFGQLEFYDFVVEDSHLNKRQKKDIF